MTQETMHVSISVRYHLMNWEPTRWWKVMRDNHGTYLEPEEVKAYFLQCLSEGKEQLPFTPCEGFDYKTGCPGHEEGEGE